MKDGEEEFRKFCIDVLERHDTQLINKWTTKEAHKKEFLTKLSSKCQLVWQNSGDHDDEVIFMVKSDEDEDGNYKIGRFSILCPTFSGMNDTDLHDRACEMVYHKVREFFESLKEKENKMRGGIQLTCKCCGYVRINPILKDVGTGDIIFKIECEKCVSKDTTSRMVTNEN